MTYPLSNNLPTHIPGFLPFPDPPISLHLVPPNYHCQNLGQELKLAQYLSRSGQQSSISSEIYRIAEQQGIKVTVLGNEEYDKLYPGTGGVTVGPSDAREVIVPERSLEDPANTTLEHELMHAYVETDGSPGKALYQTAVDTSRSPAERQAAAAALFQSIGGTSEQGRAWAEGLEGIPQSVLDGTGDHMLNSATDRLIYRQKAGQTLDTPLTLTIMRNAARGEAAMYLQHQLNPGKNEPQPGFLQMAKILSELHAMYGDEVPNVNIFDVNGSRATLTQFLDTKIADFSNTRNAYATNH